MEIKAGPERSKNIAFGVSWFYLTLYIPTALMAYLPQWYSLNFKLNSRCNIIGHTVAQQYIAELNRFLIHLSPLPDWWSAKEKLHLGEVRDMLDLLALLSVLCIVGVVTVFSRSKIYAYSLTNLAIILSLLIIIPFFETFWVNVFHPLLFDNDLWRTSFMDRSFYIMPGIFFKHSLILLITLAVTINGFFCFYFRKTGTVRSNDPMMKSKKGAGR
ncbi:MAG: DUF1461 domain-containing protein [bacterium]|nr:DUF1461 domain-containing protein [bacterium]